MKTSPDRGMFSIECQRKRLEEEPDKAQQHLDMIEYYEQWNAKEREKEQDPEWQKYNLEYDLRTCDWIIEKCKVDRYAQNLYAALCNTGWVKKEVVPLLQDQEWGCSWRYAGGIVAHLRGEGDYIDWYCSGIMDAESAKDPRFAGWVPEGVVADEIKQDFEKLGWILFKEY